MNREQIDRMGRELVRDPDLRIPMTAALSEFGTTWANWLEESGTLERLAECMVASLNGEFLESLNLWGDEVLGMEATLRHGEHFYYAWDVEYPRLCEAFGVPPVTVEVGLQDARNQDPDRPIIWFPPSKSLAISILRQSMQLPIGKQDWTELAAKLEPDDASLNAWRVRLGNGDFYARVQQYEVTWQLTDERSD